MFYFVSTVQFFKNKSNKRNYSSHSFKNFRQFKTQLHLNVEKCNKSKEKYTQTIQTQFKLHNSYYYYYQHACFLGIIIPFSSQLCILQTFRQPLETAAEFNKHTYLISLREDFTYRINNEKIITIKHIQKTIRKYFI